ncbi:hypothetical protein A2U01_0112402, partial [Trifolium medium]|nr:hypothetical protein [Trifolium medium]
GKTVLAATSVPENNPAIAPALGIETFPPEKASITGEFNFTGDSTNSISASSFPKTPPF